MQKTIHYCWLGGNPLPDEAIKCINSWKKYFPNYDIKEWNETNFDLNICSYVKEAYHKKKWAFVSDYARFWIIYNYGGLYFDTDVEVIKSFDDIITNGAFFGKEASFDKEINILKVNPGLGFYGEKNTALFKEVLDYYDGLHYDEENLETICDHVTRILESKGYIGNNDVEMIQNITLYPPEYFCPMNYYTGELIETENTHSIHRYSASWISDKAKAFNNKVKELEKKYNCDLKNKKVVILIKNLYCNGLVKTLKKVIRRV